MIDVVCFCGNSYTFSGAAGACPKCGEVVRFAASGSKKAIASGELGRPSPRALDGERPALDGERPEDMAA